VVCWIIPAFAGGARGIGRAIATQLVRSGAEVWIWDIHPVELNGAQSLSVDVTKPDQRALAPIVSQSTRIDILVNNAGYLGGYLPFDELDASECQQIVQVNLIGVFEVTRQVLPLMRRAGRGRLSIWDPSQARKACQTSQHIRLRARV
jgi:3-oxoacyl-[acyl-carrier protein] reductase